MDYNIANNSDQFQARDTYDTTREYREAELMEIEQIPW